MKLQVMAVYDAAAQLHHNPIYTPSIGAGLRGFADEVNREAPENQMNMHPDDFSLWHIAIYDTETGVITPVTRKLVMQAATVYSGPPRQPTAYDETVVTTTTTNAGRQ